MAALRLQIGHLVKLCLRPETDVGSESSAPLLRNIPAVAALIKVEDPDHHLTDVFVGSGRELLTTIAEMLSSPPARRELSMSVIASAGPDRPMPAISSEDRKSDTPSEQRIKDQSPAGRPLR